MADKATELRIKADACRRLADMDDNRSQKSIWRERADDWEALATKADQSRRSANVLNDVPIENKARQ
jgi:hypothetical protein